MAKGLVAAGLVGLALLCAAADARIVSSVVRFLHPARLLCAPRGLCARYLRSSRPRGGRARRRGRHAGGGGSAQRAARIWESGYCYRCVVRGRPRRGLGGEGSLGSAAGRPELHASVDARLPPPARRRQNNAGQRRGAARPSLQRSRPLRARSFLRCLLPRHACLARRRCLLFACAVVRRETGRPVAARACPPAFRACRLAST